MVKYILVWRKNYMDNKLKNGNSLEIQFWSDEVEVDSKSPLTKLINKVWTAEKDYIPTEEEIEQLYKDMREYHKNKSSI